MGAEVLISDIQHSEFSVQHSEFRIQQAPVFEGPLDLLLHLIERDELDITAVSLAQVTGQYLEYLGQLQGAVDETQGDALADFLVVAAKLLWIKSRALLPRPPAPEPDEEDPAEALAQQLREYRRFKLAAQALRQQEEAHAPMYVRGALPPLIVRPPGPGEGNLSALLKAVQRALISLPPTQPAGAVVTPLPFTVHDKIVLITARVHALTPAARGVHFRDLLEAANSAVEIVITLLAVLEMMKQRKVRTEQAGLFGEILIRPWAPTDEPVSVN